MKQTVHSSQFTVHSILFFLFTVNCSLLTVCYAQQKAQAATSEEKLQNAQKHYLTGKELIRQGNFPAANEEFKKAQNLMQDSPSQGAVVGLPIAQTTSEARLSQAPAQAEEQLKSPPLKTADLHYNLALTYLKTKKYKEAAAALIKALELNPEDKDAHYNLGVLYESYLNDKKKALYYYAQYIKYGKGKDDTGEVRQWMRQLKKELK